MKPTDFAIHLSGFLGNYLPAQRNVSPNTIKAYRDAFTLLLRYFRDHLSPFTKNDGIVFTKNDGNVSQSSVTGFRFRTIA